MPSTTLESRAWHAERIESALAGVHSTPNGLSTAEAAERLARFGPNRLPVTARRGPLRRFLAQFDNLLIYVLLVSAVITMLLGHPVDTAVIVLVVLINAIVGFIQEGRAEDSLRAVRRMVSAHCVALRDGQRCTLDAEQLVPGDVVLLHIGDRVTADLRLVKARNLRMEESALTGESMPAGKATDAVAADAVLGDRKCMAYSGTFVVAGQGAGIVVGTGSETEIGRISSMLVGVDELTTPLLRKVNDFARQLTFVILGASALVLLYAVLVRGYSWSEAFMVVVGLAVAAIPEGLPAVMTIAMAIGVQRMARRNAIVRRLPAVETLGSVSIICSDKTGTLTCNEMSVRTIVTHAGHYAVGGSGYEPQGAIRLGPTEVNLQEDVLLGELTQAAVLCNDATLKSTGEGWVVEGDPMEGALVSLAIKAGHDPDAVRARFPRRDEIPFDAQHRFMATLHWDPAGGTLVCIKGAPEQVLAMCSAQRDTQGLAPLAGAEWDRQVAAFAAQGQRVLAVAVCRLGEDLQTIEPGDIAAGCELLGLLGLIDPPRPEVFAAVSECRTAGIELKMITGDHAETAAAIARELRLADVITVTTGRALDRLDGPAFERCARESTVLARTSPAHKLKLVEALQSSGAIVAMTGDGVNDAPALKRADIGVAMGRKGTEVAKEAAQIVLADDNFASIVAAVREGRTVYDNLCKVIGWTLPTNGGETLIVIAAMFLGMTLPLTAAQILWINLVAAAALGMTLAFEPAEPDIMHRPPRPPDEPFLSRFLWWRVALVSVLFAVAGLAMFEWALARGLPLAEARTIVVNTIVVLDIFYLFSMRYLGDTALTWRGMLGTPAVLIGVGATVAAQLAFTYLPAMQRMFDTRAVGAVDGVVILALGVGLLLFLEIEKRLLRIARPRPR